MRRRPKDRKSTIVDAAAMLFAQRGYRAVGMKLIADQVGITAGGIYRHFSSKEELRTAVLRVTVDEANVAAEAAVNSDRPDATVAALIHGAADLAVRRPAYVTARLREQQLHPERDPDPEITVAEQTLTDTWLQAIDRAVPGLRRPELDLRYRAAEGALGALATVSLRRQEPVRAALVESVKAVLLAPAPTPAKRAKPSARTAAWTPPSSRQAEILSTAMHLFRRRGFSEVAMEDIGGALGIAASTIYSYYASKTDILMDAYDLAIAHLVVSVETSMNSAGSALEALARLVRSYVALASQNIDLVIVTAREFYAVPEVDRPRIRRRRRYFRDTWSAVLHEARGDVSATDTALLTTCALPLVSHTLLTRDGLGAEPAELSQTVLTFLLGRPVGELD